MFFMYFLTAFILRRLEYTISFIRNITDNLTPLMEFFQRTATTTKFMASHYNQPQSDEKEQS